MTFRLRKSSAEGGNRFVPMLSLPDDFWGLDRPTLEGVGALVGPRCPHVDRDGHLREIFVDPAPVGEVVELSLIHISEPTRLALI
eukprot:3293951-Alexandrium_andersonii.AAC.1